MAQTATQLQRAHYHRPIRTLYLKKRKVADNTYDAEWTRIDNFDGRDRVISWGSFTKSVNNTPTDIGNYNISSMNLNILNDDGLFSVENSGSSLWDTDETTGDLFVRYLSKIKIEVGYKDTDNTEVGVVNIFEGLLYKMTLNNDTQGSMVVISYIFLLQNLDISQVTITNTTVSGILTDIFNDPVVASILTLTSFDADNDVTIDPSVLTGSIWSVIKELCKISNAVPIISTDTLTITNRKKNSNVVDFSFTGIGGLSQNSNIISVSNYDDDGIDRLSNYFYDTSDPSINTSINTNTVSNKAFDKSIGLDLSIVATDQEKVDLLTTLLLEFSKEKPSLNMTTKFVGTLVDIFDLVDVDYHNESSTTAKWGSFKYGDAVTWGEYDGGFKIPTGVKWVVTSITNDLDKFNTVFRLEKASIALGKDATELDAFTSEEQAVITDLGGIYESVVFIDMLDRITNIDLLSASFN